MRKARTRKVGLATMTLLVTTASTAVAAGREEAVMQGVDVAGPAGVVVNEFAPSGTDSTDEFLELRNTSEQHVALNGWSILACLSSGSPVTLTVLGPGDDIAAGGHMLLAHIGYLGSRAPDLWYTVDMPDDGGWMVSDPLGSSDSVGLRGGLDCTEGSPAPDCAWSLGKSVSRDTNGTDSDDNETDFVCTSRTPGV